MTSLKGKLARRNLAPGEFPSAICADWATQNIYHVEPTALH